MMSPICSRLIAKDDLHRAPSLTIVKALSRDSRHIELDSLVQFIDHVIHALIDETSFRSSVISASIVSRSILSTKSPIRRVSRAAQVKAKEGDSSPKARDKSA